VIGFAAESENLEKYAKEKLKKKNCDLIVANDIEEGKIFGASQTKVILVSAKKTENLGKISKAQLAQNLAQKIIKFFE
jgi:phosphopantothenoylcysteine synthetase/decarboxylase